MSIKCDAIPCAEIANLAKDKIQLDILPEIEKNLDRQEKISIIFLTCPTEFLSIAYEAIVRLLEKDEEHIIFRWITAFGIKNWEEKLLESLLLIQNLQIIIELGFTEGEIDVFRERLRIDQREISPNLNRILKTLYILCEELGDKDRKLLVSQFDETDIQREELELYLLYWIKTKHISVSEASGNFKTLLKNLKVIGFDIDSPTYLSLEEWNEREKKKDSSQIPRNMQDALQSVDNSSLPIEDNGNETRINRNFGDEDHIYDFEKGLCFIINEEKFNFKWPKRNGTQKDLEKLKDTFEKFGYEIQIAENLTAKEIREKLKFIGNYTKADYDCIILCILSHGEKGTIVARDGELLTIGSIRDMICTPQLKNVVKIILVQACQGEYLGYETTDGPSSEAITASVDFDSPLKMTDQSHKLKDNTPFEHLVMFIATIPSFKSIRNTIHGSWFIQKICEVLESEDRISWEVLARRVKNEVANQRGEIHERGCSYKNIIQISEVVHDTLRKIFIFQKKPNLSENIKNKV